MTEHIASSAVSPSSLDHTVLADVVDLALWAGQLLMQHNAESKRVETTVYEIGTALGCDVLDVLVSANALVVTISSGSEFRTRTRRVIDQGVNMTMVSALSHLRHRVVRGELDRLQVRRELERIASTPRHYNRWLVMLMVGLSCAAFCRLFGGEWLVCAVAWVSASVGMLVRQEMNHRAFNVLLTVTAAALVSGVLASSAIWLQLGTQPELARAAAVLFLVPGVPMINMLEDIIKGHQVVGAARGITAALISLSIALGLILAIGLSSTGGM